MKLPTVIILLCVLTGASAWGADFTHQPLVRGRTQSAMPDAKAPAVFPRPGRQSFLEANERFRLQDEDNYAAIAGDLSVYMLSNDNSYQAIPNELYVDAAPHPAIGVVAGRRKLLYGSGMAVNPTDWLNLGKDPLNPLSQRVGAYLAAAEARFERFVATAIYAPEVTANLRGLPDAVDWQANLWLGRVYVLAWETDINLLGGYERDVPRAGASLSRYFFDILEFHVEGAARQGSDRQLFDRRFVPFLKQVDWTQPKAQAGSPPFLSQPETHASRWYSQILAGTRWMSAEGDVISFEYLWNREGLDRREWDSRMLVLAALPSGLMQAESAEDPAKQFSFQPLRRNYLFLNASRMRLADTAWLEDFSANLAVAANIDTRPSALVYPTLTYKQGQHVGVSAGVALPAGPPESEFGSLPVRELYVFELNAYL